MKKIIAISLVSIMLTITISIGFAFHFCGGKLAQFKIVVGYGEATCGMETSNSSCQNHLSSSITTVPCCQDKFFELTTDDYQQNQKHTPQLYNFSNIEFVAEQTSLKKEFESDRFQPNRPPPKINSVSLPFIQTFVI